MRVVKEGRNPWYVSKIAVCINCGCEFAIELTDPITVQSVDANGLPIRIKLPCPHCHIPATISKEK